MNRIMFVVGIMVMIASALLLVFMRLPSAQITVLLIIGVVLLGASKLRALKT